MKRVSKALVAKLKKVQKPQKPPDKVVMKIEGPDWDSLVRMEKRAEVLELLDADDLAGAQALIAQCVREDPQHGQPLDL